MTVALHDFSSSSPKKPTTKDLLSPPSPSYKEINATPCSSFVTPTTSSSFETTSQYHVDFIPSLSTPTSIPPSLALAEIPLTELRRKLPKEFFHRCLFTSSYYLCHDLFFMGLLFYLATCIQPVSNLVPYGSKCVSFLLWCMYGIAQGVVYTGLWVLAHECGHQAFSPYKKVNNMIGWLLHSFLLVPYHSWRITHSLHHKHTNHLTKDQIFIPKHASSNSSSSFKSLAYLDSTELESPFLSLLYLLRMLLGGWPAYLIYNVSGQPCPSWSSHFLPSSFFFQPHHRASILLSNVGVFFMLFLIGFSMVHFGVREVLVYYFLPYLQVNMWLVMITYLQHTHKDVPHFNSHSFTFLKGAHATMDRDYGWILNYFFHHINDSHRIHHLFSTMPHYHAIQASRFLQFPLDTTPIWKALWSTFRECKFIQEGPFHGSSGSSHVFWYTSSSFFTSSFSFSSTPSFEGDQEEKNKQKQN